jgi:ubiquinone/menaquinone biosynthesis C-methylase UbiE
MFKAILFTLLLVTVSCATHKKHAHHHRFDNVEKWSRIFEDEKREPWQNSKEIINTVGIKTNSIVADIGSATGYFPVRIARVATKGRVWGIDIEPNLVNYLNHRAHKEGIKNLYSILGTFSDPLIPEKVDFIFIVDTYHHISQRKTYFGNLKKVLKPNGQIVIVDFRKGKLPFGPKDHAKISKKQIIGELTEAGYKVHGDHGFLKYQNFLIFK